jgi:hypothetical protein
MKGNPVLYKGLVVGVIVLFISMGLQPAFAVDTNSSEKTVEITVRRYKADRTIEKTKVILSKEKAMELNERYRNINDPEIRFSLLKEYGLIPEDVTRDSLRQEMLGLAEEIGITEEKIESISERFSNNGNDTRLIGINFLNEIGAFLAVHFNLPIGLSLITGILNWNDFFIFSVDLLYIAFHFFGFSNFFNGILPDFCSFFYGFFCLLGLIGYVVSAPFLGVFSGIVGFTVASLAIPVVMGRFEW